MNETSGVSRPLPTPETSVGTDLSRPLPTPETSVGTDLSRPLPTPDVVWQVYARRKYEEPLHEIGNVMADDVELAKVYARSIYDEFSWVEMVIIPRDSIVTVISS